MEFLQNLNIQLIKTKYKFRMGRETWGAFEKLDLERKHWPRNRRETGKWSASYNVKLCQGHCVKVSGNRGAIYRMYHHILSWVLEVISEEFLTEKCYINIGTIFSGYRAKGRRECCVGWNLRTSVRLLGRCASDNMDTNLFAARRSALTRQPTLDSVPDIVL